jgi:tetratricopeptide (TPR) repeat protein
LSRLVTHLAAGIAMAVLAIGMIPTSAWSQRGSAADLWNRARAETQGDSAAVLLRRLIDEYPRHLLVHDAQSLLADYYFARGDYPQARLFYHRAAEKKEGDGRARLGEARSYYALGDYATARNAARPLLQTEDGRLSWTAAFLIALCWEAEERYEEAYSAHRRLLARPVGPAQPAALLAAARTAFKLELNDEARDLLLRLNSQYPESPEAIEASRLEFRHGGDEETGS